MRRGLSFILVLLLVLRGLLGDAMAMGAAPVPQPAAPAHHHAPSDPDRGVHALMGHEAVHPQQAAGHADHADHVPVHEAAADACAPSASAQDADCGHEHGPACSACGICHSALYTPDLPVPPQALASTALRPLGGERFASAPAALLIKPPIS